MAPEHADTLRSMRAIYIDAGKKDEYFLDLGAEAFRRELEAIGVTDVFFELFEGTHMSIEYRYPLGPGIPRGTPLGLTSYAGIRKQTLTFCGMLHPSSPHPAGARKGER